MKLTRRTFLLSSVAAGVVAALPSVIKASTIDTGGGRSLTGTLPFGRYTVTAEIEFASAPREGDLVEFYWGPSGASVINSQFIGGMLSLPEQSIVGYVGTLEPGCEKGQLIVKNNTSQPMNAKVEMTKLEYVVSENENEITELTRNPIIFDELN